MPICAGLLAIVIAATQQPDAQVFEVMKRAARAVELDSVRVVEAQWARALSARPTDRATLFGLSRLSYNTYRYERADSLALRLLGIEDATQPTPRNVDQWAVMGRLTLAAGLSTSNPLRADTVLQVALSDAQTVGSARLQANILFSLAQLRARARGPRVGLALLRESRVKYPKGQPEEEAFRLCAEGSFVAQTGDTLGIVTLARGSLLAQTTRAWRVYAECRVQTAQLLSTRGFFDAALQNLDVASYWLRRVRADGALSATLQRSAYVRFERGEVAQARLDYLNAASDASRARNKSVEAWARQGLGEIGIALNDFTTARAELDRAMAMHRAASDQWGIAASRFLQGTLAEAMGDVAGARTALAEVIDTYVKLGQQASILPALRQLAQLELRQGRVDEAERMIARATVIATANRNRGWLAELPYHLAGTALARGNLDAADSLLRSVSRRDSLDGSLGYSYWIRVADVASRKEDFAAAERAVQRAMRILADWREDSDDKDVRLRLSAARGAWGNVGQELPGLVDRFAKAGRVSVAFALAESARARELTAMALQQAALSTVAGREAAAFARLRKTASRITVADVQARLDDSTALIAYVAGRGLTPTTMFVVTKRAVGSRSLAPVDSISKALDRFVRLASDGADPSALASQIGDAVFNPAVALLAAGITRLTIVPELSLYRVPFDALRMADGRTVVQRFSVSVVPSVTFAMNAVTPPATSTGSLVAFGDALYGASSAGTRSTASTVASMAEGAATAIDDVRTLPRLPFSGDEARRVAQYSRSATVLVRGMATERALRTLALKNVRVLHLATHAIVDDRNLQRNALALTPGNGDDGRVGPEELGALGLDGALVVLSGCRTVGGVVLGGEGLRGLTGPLLEAGASAVVATQWPVGDASILPMVDRFYAHLATGVSAATALRRAKLDAQRDNVSASVWAAFVLVGDGNLRVPLSPIRAAPLPWIQRKAAAQ